MAEVVGCVAAVEGLIKGTGTLYTFAHDVYRAPEERQQLQNVLKGTGGLQSQLEDLKEKAKRADEADEEEAFLFAGLLKLRDERSTTEEKAILGNNIGCLSRMQDAMDAMQKELKPGHGHMKGLKRLKWFKDKSDAKEKLEEINTWKSQVEWALNMDLHTAMLATYGLVKENAKDTKQLVVQGGDIQEKLQKLELRSEEQKFRDEKREQELEKATREKLIEAIADWLSPLDFYTRHSELLETENRIDMSHDLIKSQEFQSWRASKPWVLYCWADAGAGKTMLTSMIIEHLQSHFKNADIPVLYLYLNHKDQGAQTAVNLIGSLLKQLIMYKKPPFASEELVQLYNEKVKKTRLKAEDKMMAFCKEMQHYDRVVVVVDALDEGSRSIENHWNDLLPELPLDKLSVMVTSRREEAEVEKGMSCDRCGVKPINLYYACYECPEPFYICYECRSKGEVCNNASHIIEDPLRNEEVFLNVSPSYDAIQLYVKNEIHREVKAGRSLRDKDGLYKRSVGTTVLGRLCEKHPDLEEEVINTICIKANDKFLLAKLYVDSLKLKHNKADIRQALKNLPRGYSDTYEQTMKRIELRKSVDSDGYRLAISTLSWIVHVNRPLTVEELCHALATTPENGFDEERIHDRDTLLEVTAGLVVIVNDIVKLPHYTAQEYFNGDGSKWFDFDVSARIACTSLDYMSTPALCTPLPLDSEQADFEDRKAEYPFLAYAYEYWGYHAKEAGSDEETSRKVLAFLRKPVLVATFVQAFWYLESAESSRWEIRRGATAVHVAAWFGLTSVTAVLAKQNGIDVNAKDPGLELTPLIYAARRGHADTVKMLLDLGAAVNETSVYGTTALYEAFLGSHVDVARIILQHIDLNINYRYFWKLDRTILMEVATHNISPMLDLILELRKEDIDVNLSDSSGHTALALACAHGHTLVVERLLDHLDIDVDVQSDDGYTALSLGASCRNYDDGSDIAKQLLDHHANPNIRDMEGGGTPIIRAVDEGSIPALEVLCKHDAYLIRQVDYDERSVLHAAAVGGHAEIAQNVVEKGVNVNMQDKKGRTPLHDAARIGSSDVIKVLLDLGATSQPDRSGREPWKVAWQNGHISVLHLLNAEIRPATNGLIPSSALLNTSILPLWSLAKHGREELISNLAHTSPTSFQRADIDPDTGDTAIHSAINTNRPSILRLILSANMPSTIPNFIGRTPLHAAAVSPNKDIMTLLLSSVPHDPSTLDAVDKNNNTPLWFAYRYGFSHTACLLVAAGAKVAMKAMILPLFFNAIEYGYLEAVQRMVEEYAAPVTAKNRNGESAMQVARVNGNKHVERFLVRCRTVYVGSGEVVASPASEGEREGDEWLRERHTPSFPKPEDVDDEEVKHVNVRNESEVDTLTNNGARQERHADRMMMAA